jgi:hypothetical protein
MSDLETVVRQVAGDYYFSLPHSTRSGARVFVDDMLELLRTPGLGSRVREAAAACEAEYPIINPNPFQENLRAAIFDCYMRSARPHPRRQDMAAAAADTIVAEFTTDRVEAAQQRAARHAAASEHLWEIEQARWREAEIARNRPRPKRVKLYPC